MLKFVSLRSHSRLLSQGRRHAGTRTLRGRKIRAAYALGASVALCAVIAGCAVANNTAPSAPVSNGPQTPASPKYATVTNFGASITCGYYAAQQGSSGNIYSTLGYAGVFDSSLSGTTAQNLCRAGDMAADTARTWVMPNAVPALDKRQLYTMMTGTNDLLQCGGQTGCLPNYINAMTAALSWLALPSSDKVLGSSLSVSSAWTPDLNIGVSTSTAGASLSFPVRQAVDGRTLYIAYRVFDAGKTNGGTATVQLDGKTVATLSTIANGGRGISTPNGTTDTIWAVGIPLGAVGAHTVTITNGSGGGFFSFQWAGVSSGQYASTAGAPRVMVALLPQSTEAYFNSVEVTHNNALNQLATALAADGMWVTVVHCESVLDIPKDMVDNVHPGTAGHAKLAAAFDSVL